jgi:hypothetical protein
MPTKAKEYVLYTPGRLIKSCVDIYSTDPAGKIIKGTSGIILRREKPKRLLVQFTGDITWWVNQEEIEPYLPTWREYP